MKTMFAAIALAIAIPAAAQTAPATTNPHAHHQGGHGDHKGDHKPGADHKAHHEGCMKSGKSKAECEKMCAEHKKGQGAGHDMSQHQGHPQS
jgi:hypothetical protein